MKTIIIFTDLDGTLLDHLNYSFDPALEALNMLREKNIPLVICSSKTRPEIESYRNRLGNKHPFMSENGGGIFIPKGYFWSVNLPVSSKVTEDEDYSVIVLGTRYSELRKALMEIREEGFDIRGFGDMDAKDIADITGLSIGEAEMARQRDFDETFFFEGTEENIITLRKAIRNKGFNYTKGRYHHIMGNSDKGRGLEILKNLYKMFHGDITAVAIGDSLNDLPMLEKADYSVIVQKPDGGYDPGIEAKGFIKADGIGPKGWNRAVMDLLSRSDSL